jgi:hypothetical protein
MTQTITLDAQASHLAAQGVGSGEAALADAGDFAMPAQVKATVGRWH